MKLQPNVTTTYIRYNDGDYYIPSDCSFTRGCAWETIERRSTDSSNTAQAISLMYKYGYQPKTYQVSFNLYKHLTDEDLFDLLYVYESLVGKQVQFIYSNFPFGDMVITDGTFSLTTDGVAGIVALNISYNMRESTVVTTSSAVSVRTL